MPSRLWLIVAAVLPIVFLSCRDDEDIEALKQMAAETSRESRRETASQPQTPLTLPAPPYKLMPHGGRKLQIPDQVGSIEWTHQTGQPTVRMYFVNTQGEPIENVSEPVVWLVASAAPADVDVHPCDRAEPGCFEAGSPLFAEGVPRGIVRFQIGRQRYRVTLPARPAEPTADSRPTSSPGLPLKKAEGSR
jgi:hypothetical protein